MILSEHILNIGFKQADTFQKEEYLPRVKEILDFSYSAIGGCGASDEELLADNCIWKLGRKDGKICACMIYKTSLFGRKICFGGTDGTVNGKSCFMMIMREDKEQCSSRLTWGEFSGAPAHIMRDKLGMPRIPSNIASKILADMGKEVLSVADDGFTYTRKIAGIPREKEMFGYYPPKYNKE